ncbi:MAG: DUF3524 domain-containing protein [Nitrospirota bacterium]|nr:DUF3524 domain-containing protein [Nitrospirota bacterium]
MADTLNVLALEPWHAGSHQDFLNGLAGRSHHRFHLHTLPGRYWKWRQTGSGMILAHRVLADPPPCDLIFASDFLNLPDFLALTRRRWPNAPAVLYFHENQFTYPLSEGHDLDPAYPQANLSGAAVADAVWFNSEYHLTSFLAGLDQLLSMCPDFAPRHLADAIAAKSAVMPLGVDLEGLTPHLGPPGEGPLTILWNHRWEHDKNPDGFFAALFALAEAGHDFRLIVAGQAFSRVPKIFDTARTKLAAHIDHWGYVEDRARYAALLGRADVVVSVAHHDFFGVGVVEAVHANCLPILANRLNYPHLVPEKAHARCLLNDDAELVDRLEVLVRSPALARQPGPGGTPRNWAAPYDWGIRAPAFDQAFSKLVKTAPHPA